MNTFVSLGLGGLGLGGGILKTGTAYGALSAHPVATLGVLKQPVVNYGLLAKPVVNYVAQPFASVSHVSKPFVIVLSALVACASAGGFHGLGLGGLGASAARRWLWP
ncbi:secreted protein, putative [Ixodes scapularis]|uniref:Secreted protein, putative n=1 Tax=Ixodes scapularis TaxID=6945 RepID=B7PGH8_IXOSC|nr:secreted protein, putative [Ixodes scapularis]|eukprot:XP_002434300.1 secreted protein, putative [Ixodes scapularis]